MKVKNFFGKRRIKQIVSAFLTLSIFTIVSCDNGDNGRNDPEPESTKDIEDFINNLPYSGIPSGILINNDTLPPEFDVPNNFVCEQIEVDAQGAVGEYRTFDPNSDIVWPGNLLQGRTLTQSTPEAVDVNRAGGTYTIDLVNGSKGTKVDVPKVTQAYVIEGINKILRDNEGTLPANFVYTEHQVRSKEEIALALGVDAKVFTSKFNLDISNKLKNSFNSVMVDFVQKYYTISYQSPTSFDQVFDSTVTVENLKPYMGPDNHPVYIKSVTYGRRYYLLITSKSSVREMKASIKASYDAAIADVDIEVGATYIKNLKEVEVNVFAFGGDAESAATTFNGDFDAVRKFLSDGGSINTGLPLSYKMESLAFPHQDVGIGITSRFSVPNCQPIYSNTPGNYTFPWFGIFDNEGIGSACAIDKDQSNSILFNQSGTEYAQIIGGKVQGIFTLGAPSDQGRLSGCPISPIGAASVFDENIIVYSEDGMQYVIQSSSGNWGKIKELDEWVDFDFFEQRVIKQHPFLNPNAGGAAGVGAAVFLAEPSFPSPSALKTRKFLHFNEAGNRFVEVSLFQLPGTNTWYPGRMSSVKNLEDLGGNDTDLPFSNVGSSLYLKDGGVTKYFFFNKEGSSFTILDSESNQFSEVYNITLKPN